MALQPTAKLSILQSQAPLADPHIASDNKDRLSILAAMLEALVRFDARGNFVPALAAGWTVAEDARSWTFKLRRNVTFHNGDPLRPEDVVASIRRACDPALGGDLGTEGLYYSYLKDMSLNVLDEQTVQMITATPMADLLDLIVDIPIVSQVALGGLPANPVGSGPYRLLEAGDGRVVMVAFEQYWGVPPPVDRLVWQAEPDAGQRVEMLLSGETDLVTQAPLADRQRLSEAATTELVVAPSSVCAVFMCNAQAGVCTDKRVRQALNYALDMPAIIDEVMAGMATPLNGPLTSLHFGYDPDTLPYPYNPAKAKALLAAAGHENGLTLVLNVPTQLPDEAVHLARLMARYYTQVGISTEIKAFSDRPGYAQRVKTKQIDDACCFDSSPLSTFRPLREKFHSGLSGPWWQGYANPDVDQLLDQAQATANTAARQQLYRRAYRLIRDDAAWIFFYSPMVAWGIGPRAYGWRPTIDALVKPA